MHDAAAWSGAAVQQGAARCWRGSDERFGTAALRRAWARRWGSGRAPATTGHGGGGSSSATLVAVYNGEVAATSTGAKGGCFSPIRVKAGPWVAAEMTITHGYVRTVTKSVAELR